MVVDRPPRISRWLSFYGSKWRAAPLYPPPQYDLIIEPFAGGAGYSTLYYDRDVLLVEKDPKLAAVWRFLIWAKRDDILDLPLLEPGQHIDETGLEGARRWLVGWWLQGAVYSPRCSLSSWSKPDDSSSWGEKCRARLASQVEKINHWKIIEGDYTDAPEIAGNYTWFIDPPYNNRAGSYYYGASSIKYHELGAWCKSRRGQVIVCENEGATWLPFKPFATIKAGVKHRSKEAIWLGPLDD